MIENITKSLLYIASYLSFTDSINRLPRIQLYPVNTPAKGEEIIRIKLIMEYAGCESHQAMMGARFTRNILAEIRRDCGLVLEPPKKILREPSGGYGLVMDIMQPVSESLTEVLSVVQRGLESVDPTKKEQFAQLMRGNGLILENAFTEKGPKPQTEIQPGGRITRDGFNINVRIRTTHPTLARTFLHNHAGLEQHIEQHVTVITASTTEGMAALNERAVLCAKHVHDKM